MLVSIRKLLTCKKNLSEYFIGRLVEVNVTCSYYGDSKFVAEFYDSLVDFNKRFFALNNAFINHKLIVAERLNFKIIIELCHVAKVGPGFSLKDCLIKFACFTGRTDNKPVSVLFKDSFWDSRVSVIVVEIGVRNELVEVLETYKVFNQDNLMITL